MIHAQDIDRRKKYGVSSDLLEETRSKTCTTARGIPSQKPNATEWRNSSAQVNRIGVNPVEQIRATYRG